MPKSKDDHIEKTAKILFKNSRNTINTYSKTYSGASQVFTKSLILRLKQNVPTEEYYEENGRVLRDLSIETDICILRGYYKKRRNKIINRGTVSTKSKYSVNRTEIDTIDEFKYDSSACGDSTGSMKLKNKHFNINLTSLVVQNLKKLLNDWIKTYLLNNDETKEKIETVLDSILHKLDLQRKETVSSCTYTVDIEVLDQKRSQIMHPIKSLAARQGSLSVPLSGKGFRILSTLSVPKNISRPKGSKYSWKKFNNIRHKKILLSNNGSNKYLYTSSSLNFLMLPTNFLTKRCATYQQHDPKKNKEKPRTLVIPDELFGAENSFQAIAQNPVFDAIPSIYKNIFNQHRHKQNQDSIINNGNRKNEHEQGTSEPLMSIDFLNQSFNFVGSQTQNEKKEQNENPLRSSVDKIAKKDSRRSKKIISRKHRTIRSKKIKCFFKKSKNHTQLENDILYHFQSIFKMISCHKGGEEVKLDIHVNVFPSSDSTTKKNTCEYSYPLTGANTNTLATQQTVNDDPVSHDPKIIPILDGAVSQSKYIMSGETSASENNNHVDNKTSNIAKNSQIILEINELKMIIKALVSTTEKFVNEHLSKKSTSKDILKQVDDTKECPKDVEVIPKPSIGVQCSNRFVQNNQVGSGIKLKKDPKKKRKEYTPRLIKRSTSYNIIDSESILKVTDMTSAAQGEINNRDRVDRALTCSLPITKSLFEISRAKCDVKLSAIHCGDLMKPTEYVYNVYEHKNKQSYTDKDTNHHFKQLCNEAKAKSGQRPERTEYVESAERVDKSSNSSIYIDVEPKTHGKKITIRPRTGMRFCEGCCYCILLWIPVLAILWLFHEYVLIHYLPEEFSLRRIIWSKRDYINESYLRLTLADLGF